MGTAPNDSGERHPALLSLRQQLPQRLRVRGPVERNAARQGGRQFAKSGDPRYFWTETAITNEGAVALTWYDIGEPLLIHTNPGEGGRKYGVCTLLVPSLGARLTVDGVQAAGKAVPIDREGRPFSTCALAFSESWTEAR